MHKMGTEDRRGEYPVHHSDTESVGSERSSFSGPLSGPLAERGGPKSDRLNIQGRTTTVGDGCRSDINSQEEDYVEITLDLCDDSVAVYSVPTAGGADGEDLELRRLASTAYRRSGNRFDRTASTAYRPSRNRFDRTASTAYRPSRNRFDRTKSAAAQALKGLKFISEADGDAGWPVVEKRFNELTASTNGLLPRSHFGACIGMTGESEDFAGVLFDSLARKRNIADSSINKVQLEEFWEQISDQSFDSRLQTFFDMVDKDADGRITEEEIGEIIRLSASANRLSNIKQQAAEYAALIMEELDPDNYGYIFIEILEFLLLEAASDQSVRGDSRNLSQMLSRELEPTPQEKNPLWRLYNRSKYFLMDNWQRVWVMALWLGIVSGLFGYKFVQYRHRTVFDIMGYCVCTAKGAAETLKFNMALILLPVCRNTITWLRNRTKLGLVIPFDYQLNFHKVIAVGIVLAVGLHAGAHLTCDFPRLLHAKEEEYEPMKPFFGDEQPKTYWWFIKGVEGVTGIIMLVLMAIAFTLATSWFRQNKLNLPGPMKRITGFNAFWYSHHLFVIVYILLIVHGICLNLSKKWYQKTTWMYLAIPVVMFACERLIRAFRSSVKPVKIHKVAVYPGNVLALHMSKPHGFKYKSGQYMFLNCAAVSPFEWHPFFMTSAPGDDYLSVHIRTLGDWTRQLRIVFSEACQPPTSGKSGPNNLSLPRLLIDGPYETSVVDYKKYEVLLLVAIGIGATPMVSIVKDMVNIMKAMKENEGSTMLETTKVYYYWITREQGSFEWFKEVMNEVVEMDQKGVIELHNYITSVYEEGDARSALIAMLQSLNHAKKGIDVVSETRVKSHFGRPKWRKAYKRIAINHRDARVGVFYCGPPSLAKELRQLALDFSHKTSTKFDFHNENF